MSTPEVEQVTTSETKFLDSKDSLLHIERVLREDLKNLEADIQREVAGVRLFENHPIAQADSQMVEAARKVVAELQADILAIRRILARLDRGAPITSQDNLPKTVGELLHEYLAQQSEPFTVKMATDAIRAAGAKHVTESAVAQALRRDTEKSVKLLKKGVGPNPAFFQRFSGTGMAAGEADKQ